MRDGRPPLKPVPRIHIPCAELLSGLCKTRDAAVLPGATTVAERLHGLGKHLGRAGVSLGSHTLMYSKVFMSGGMRFTDRLIAAFAEGEEFQDDVGMC